MVGAKLRIKKGDKVKMRTGKDAGKSGKVIKVYPLESRVAVEGINLLKKNVRPKKQGERGQVISVPAAVRVDNVQLVCPSCNKATRIGIDIKGKKKERHCKKCNAKI